VTDRAVSTERDEARAVERWKAAGMIAWLAILVLFFTYVGDAFACAGFLE
jgi:uncharacterized DUF497 family protein